MLKPTRTVHLPDEGDLGQAHLLLRPDDTELMRIYSGTEDYTMYWYSSRMKMDDWRVLVATLTGDFYREEIERSQLGAFELQAVLVDGSVEETEEDWPLTKTDTRRALEKMPWLLRINTPGFSMAIECDIVTLSSRMIGVQSRQSPERAVIDVISNLFMATAEKPESLGWTTGSLAEDLTMFAARYMHSPVPV